MKKYTIVFCAFIAVLLLFGCNQEAQEPAGSSQVPASSGASDPSLDKVMQAGELVVGADVPYAPMELFDDAGNIVGYDIDVVQGVADAMGVKLKMVDYDWDALFEAVKANEIDLAISSITITPERSAEMLFSMPYFNGGQVILTRKDSGIMTAEDLKDKKIGVQEGTTSADEALKYTNEGSVISGTTYDDMIPALQEGEIDAFIIDLIAGVNYAKEHLSFQVVGDPITEEFYGIASHKSNRSLMDEVNKALRDMKRDGELSQSNSKWMK